VGAGSTAEGNLELFFDLVFTFAMSQVTQLMLRRGDSACVVRYAGLAALALLAAIGGIRLAWELWQRPRIGTGVAGQAR
jgi:low temperature requirement protein LtrA